MRPLEIILLITLLIPIIFAFLPQQKPRWVMALPFGGLIVMVLHFIFEGMRWQMFPAYGLLVLLTVLNIRPLLTKSPAEKRKRTWMLGILGLLAWLLALFLPVALPVPQLMSPSGEYDVGTTVRYLVDKDRPESYTEDPNDNRELMAQIWYPATNTADSERATYLPSLDKIGPAVADKFGLPAFFLNHINLTPLDIYTDAPIAEPDAPFPVIIFSHGLTGIRMQNTAMFQELASHGYVVGAVDHAYANAITVYPDGRVVAYDDDLVFPTDEPRHLQANNLMKIWSADIGFLLDEMALWNGEDGGVFNGRLDLTHVGIFGHSTGGGTTVEFCQTDARCTAGIGLDSWVMPVTESLQQTSISQPFMFISTPDWLGRRNRAVGQAIFNNLANDGYNLTIANTGHYDFSDLVLLSPFTPQLGLSGSIDSQYSLGIQTQYILAFFDQYLRGMDDGVLKRPSAYPELRVEVR